MLRALIAARLRDYNENQPHNALGYRTLVLFAVSNGTTRNKEGNQLVYQLAFANT